MQVVCDVGFIHSRDLNEIEGDVVHYFLFSRLTTFPLFLVGREKIPDFFCEQYFTKGKRSIMEGRM